MLNVPVKDDKNGALLTMEKFIEAKYETYKKACVEWNAIDKSGRGKRLVIDAEE